MGRQTFFFMNAKDLKNFLGFVREQGDIIIHEEPGQDFGPVIVGTEEELNEFKYYISNSSLKVSFVLFDRDLDKDLKIIEKFPEKDREELIRLAKERAERIGYLKDSDSDVIELSPSKVLDEDKRITEGRIWVELYNFDEHGQKYYRGAPLESIYVKYSRYIKKKFKLDRSKRYYIGPGAYELYMHGWWMGEGPKQEQFKKYW